MTAETMDSLDRLSNPTLAREAEQARNRSSFRPVWQKVTCDIASIAGPYEATLNNGQNVTRCSLHLVNMRQISAVTPFMGTEADLELGLPSNPNVNSELVLMTASANAINPEITSIRQLAGLKNVRLEERVHEYQRRFFEEDPEGTDTDKKTGAKGNWVDSEGTPKRPHGQTRYYHVVSIGGSATANGNGASAPTEERLAEAIHLIEGADHATAMSILGEDGAAVLSKLVLSKRVQQDEEKKYQPV